MDRPFRFLNPTGLQIPIFLIQPYSQKQKIIFKMTTKDNSLKTPLGRLLKIGFAEGVSFLVLLFIAMPLKYMAGMPTPVRIIGMLHGVLFIGYAFALLQAKIAYQWSIKKATIAFLLSFVPFGTFYLESVLKKPKPISIKSEG